MTKYRIYCQQLGHDEDWLRFMESHAELLLPIASRHTPTCTLLEDSQATANGKKLGRKELERVVADIEAKITASRKGIDELRWTTEDTRRIVNEILGNPDVKVNKKYHCVWVGSDKVKIKAIDAVIDSLMSCTSTTFAPTSSLSITS